MAPQKKLSEEDLERIQYYLNSPNHQVNRKPFKPWLLLGVILLLMAFLSLFSYVIAKVHGVV